MDEVWLWVVGVVLADLAAEVEGAFPLRVKPISASLNSTLRSMNIASDVVVITLAATIFATVAIMTTALPCSPRLRTPRCARLLRLEQ